MIRRTTRIVVEVIAAFVGVLLLIAGFGAWRLASGPIPIDFLTPYMVEALSGDGSARVEFHGTVLAWQGGRRTVEVEVRDVSVVGLDGTILASAPELAVRFSMRALLRGRIEPTGLDLQGAKVLVRRDAGGNLIFGMGQGQGAAGGQLPNLLSGLLGPPDPDKRLGYLRRVSVSDSTVTIQDEGSGKSWDAAIKEASVTRTRRSGLDLDVNLDIVAEGKTAEFKLTGAHEEETGALLVTIKFTGVDFAALGAAVPELVSLRMLAMPLHGQVTFSLDADQTVRGTSFEFAGGPGRVIETGMEGGGIAIKSVTGRGNADDGLTRLTLSDFNLQLDGPTVTASAVVNDPLGTGNFDLKATVQNVAFDRLKHYWPPGMARGGRRWMLANMTEGIGQEVRLTASGQLAPPHGKDPAIKSLNGTIKADGLSVRYMPEMPVVLGIAATATFDLHSLNITTQGGMIEGLTVSDGVIKLTGLDTAKQFADIDVKIVGPARNALTLIDHEPLHYASKMDIDPANVEGDAAIRLIVRLPLIDALPVEKVQISTDATLSRLQWRDVVLGKTLTEATVTLHVDNSSMDAAGNGLLADVPVKFRWRENFASSSGDTGSVEFSGTLDDAARKSFGLDIGKAVSGPVGVNGTLTFRRPEPPRINADLDLTGARVDVDAFAWEKEPGVPAKIRIESTMDAEQRLNHVAFDGSGAGLSARGQIQLRNGQLKGVDFDHLVVGRNDLRGAIAIGDDGGYLIRGSGASFDLSDFFSADGEESQPKERKPKAERPPLPPLDIKLEADRVWLGKERWFDDVKATFVREPAGWRTIEVNAKVGPDGKSFQIEYGPKAVYRNLLVRSDDAGETLRMLGLIDNAIGGTLQVTGKEETAEAPLKGEILVENFRVLNAPVLARILSAASLTGIVQTMTGKGLQFDKFRADYSIADELVELHDGRARSADLGLTIEGKIDLLSDNMDLKGLIVPAYTINSLLANIPLIGELFGGPGGGIFAATYTMRGSLSDPSVGVNPLAVLTPGVFRYIFSIFDGPSGVSDAPATPPSDIQTKSR